MEKKELYLGKEVFWTERTLASIWSSELWKYRVKSGWILNFDGKKAVIETSGPTFVWQYISNLRDEA